MNSSVNNRIRKAVGVLFMVLLFALTKNKANATNLRGQVLRYNPNYGTSFALPGVRVDLMIWNGNQWIDAAYYVTGNDGFYFFFNVQPGYVFQIMVFSRFAFAQTQEVGSVNPPYFQDIPLITA
jgi:hypothetical protein